MKTAQPLFTKHNITLLRWGMHHEELADRYAGQRCTLNGQRATITGRKIRFATVAQVSNGLRAEYAWETVAHVMQKGGQFKA